ncbi:MAG: SpoIIIAC/SpoIIIAD family protein [Oscillospiraceae bacterium]
MSLAALAGLCLAVTILCKLIERDSRETAALVALICAVFVAVNVLGDIKRVLDMLGKLFEKADIDASYLKILFKALGICFVTQLATDVCRDNGENALATQLELAGKCAVLVVSIPLFSAVIAIIEALLG